MADDAWWRHGPVYQIYPRSFADSNGDGVGDLAGVTSRLDHLNDGTSRSLGVRALWLSPFYPSPMHDNGYDVADYCDVDPRFGTLADFDRLLEAAHQRDIRVVIDFVPNHTSIAHPWFHASRSSRDDPRRDWYVWADPAPDAGPPNNWRSVFANVGPAWTLDERTGQYYLHSFMREQPDLNWWNPAVRAAMHDVLRFWLDRGVDGFRIDVAHRMAHDPELRDNPTELSHPLQDNLPFGSGQDTSGQLAAGTQDTSGQLSGEVGRTGTGLPGTHDGPGMLATGLRPHGQRDEDWPEVHAIHRGFRAVLDEYEDRAAIGEVYVSSYERLAAYYGQAHDELHLVHNFLFMAQPWRAAAFRESVEAMERALPDDAWPTYFTGNHDHPRVVTRYDEDGGHGRRRAACAALMILTLRGTPFLYQGEELGMADVAIPPELAVDVDGRDPQRAPVSWDNGPGGGFTTGTPWLPLATDRDRASMTAQRDDPDSMLALYRRLVRLRTREPALREGAYRSLPTRPDVFAYTRGTGDGHLVIALNMAGGPSTVTLGNGQGTVEVGTDRRRDGTRVDLDAVTLDRDEGVVLRPVPKAVQTDT